jgi:hypothetical protein
MSAWKKGKGKRQEKGDEEKGDVTILLFLLSK